MVKLQRGKRIHASVDWPMQAVHLYLRRFTDDGKQEVLTENGWLHYEPGSAPPPLTDLDMDIAQGLFEELWAQGFRSLNDRTNSDKLDVARKEHINDLRKFAKIA